MRQVHQRRKHGCYTIGITNLFGYSNYYQDIETGLYYLNSRYYNPDWGRFINADCLTTTNSHDPLGANMFAYCENNPVNTCDPNGMYVMGFGWYATAGMGPGGSYSLMTIWDDEGNKANIRCGYYGGGTPNVGAGYTLFLYSSADNIFDYVYGDSFVSGGSFEIIGINGTCGSDEHNNLYGGFDISVGFGAPAELHCGISYANITELIMYNGADVPESVTLEFFSRLGPNAREGLKQDLGLTTSIRNNSTRCGSQIAYSYNVFIPMVK